MMIYIEYRKLDLYHIPIARFIPHTKTKIYILYQNQDLYRIPITKLPNSEQSYKGKVQTHNYINRQNQSTTGKL
jgi:hypothetical protein